MGIVRSARAAILVLLLACAGGTLQARDAGLVEESVSVPATLPGFLGERTYALAALLVRPDGAGPFPIVLLSHGSPRNASDRRTMRPESAAAQARDFARRGWAALSLMRRGYGPSEGEFAEDSGRCDARDYTQSGRESARDLRAGTAWLAAQPWADRSRLMLVGVSAGGFASVALAAEPPPGLVAVISFAGGRGSRGPNDVCQPDRLVRAFETFGRTARVPSLWIYAQNDLFFGPELSRALHAAYTAGGAPAEFHLVPPFGRDGHTFYGRAQELWWPLVDDFLRRQRLPAR